VFQGRWDSIHVVDVQERSSGRNAQYKLTSTAMLWLQTDKPTGSWTVTGAFPVVLLRSNLVLGNSSVVTKITIALTIRRNPGDGEQEPHRAVGDLLRQDARHREPAAAAGGLADREQKQNFAKGPHRRHRRAHQGCYHLLVSVSRLQSACRCQLWLKIGVPTF